MFFIIISGIVSERVSIVSRTVKEKRIALGSVKEDSIQPSLNHQSNTSEDITINRTDCSTNY